MLEMITDNIYWTLRFTPMPSAAFTLICGKNLLQGNHGSREEKAREPQNKLGWLG
jgi:hypothetical protein